MDQIRLAQFFKAGENIIVQKPATLDKSLFSCCVSNDPPETLGKKDYAGYNCLHNFCSNLHVVQRLLDEGADLLKQGTQDGKTPLHCVIDLRGHILEQPLQLLASEIKNVDIVNTLLSAQISRNKSDNVKCNMGMTHLHIACIVNHLEAVSMFLKAGASLDEQMNINENSYTAGYTALHFAIEFSSIDAARILLQNNSNIHLKSAKGVSPLALLINRIQSLKEHMCMGQRVLCYPYQKEIAVLEEIAKFILQADPPLHINCVDNTEPTMFHLACSLTDPSVASELLTENNMNLCVSKDSQLWPEWTPLHFAACSGVETFKLLLQNGACINAKNSRGETPLDFCIMIYYPEVVYSILLTKIEIRDIFLSDGVTKLLDLLLAMQNSDTLNTFLQNLPDVNASVPVHSPVWPGCNALHLAVKCNDKTKAHKELHGKYINKLDTLPQVYNCTEDDQNTYLNRINVCLARSCSVSAQNADGLSPIHLVFYMQKEKIVDVLMDNCHDNAADSKNLSILHIACVTGRMDVVERLVNGGANINSQTTSNFECYKIYTPYHGCSKFFFLLAAMNSTPLHLAVIFGHNDTVKYLVEKGADVYAINVYGLTPIHLSMANPNIGTSTVRLLLELVPDLKESVSIDNLTHLHVAAFAGDETSIEKLLQQGSPINAIFNGEASILRPKNESARTELSLLSERYSGTSPLYAAVKSSSESAISSLLQNGGAFCVEIFKRHRLLRDSMDTMPGRKFRNFFLETLKGDDRVGAIDPSGVTLLHVAYAIQDLEWAKELLKRGADPNAQITGLYDDDGHMYYESYGGTKECWTGITPLHVFIDRAIWDNTPLDVLEDFVKSILQYGADVTIKSHDGTPLHMAYDVICSDPSHFLLMNDGVSEELAETWTYIADMLFDSQKSFDVNPIDEYGCSHFHYACWRNKVDIVKKYLENGVDINHSTDPFVKDDGGSTGLHFAFEKKSVDVARLLIERGADLKVENVNGDTPLHVALANGVTDLPIFEMMLSKGADINAYSIFYSRRPIDSLSYSNNVQPEVVNFLLDNGSTTDLTAGTGISIGNLVKNFEEHERQSILSRIMKILKIRNAIENSFNAIASIVAVDQEAELPVEFYLDNIHMFMEIGCLIDQQNEKGKTALYEAASLYNLQAIEALLLLGADINVLDNKENSPFPIKAFEYIDSRIDCQRSTLVILSKHVYKMKLVGLKVHESNENALEATLRKTPLESDFKGKCVRELEELQRTELGGSLTMKDFLNGSRVVNSYPTMSFVQRQTIMDFFGSADDLRKKFPEFAGLLIMQNKKAVQREELYRQVKRVLANIQQVQLPDLCAENFLKYLENDELVLIVECEK